MRPFAYAFEVTLDLKSAFGRRAARRLREETVGWLVTVDGRGTPQPILVWFLWDGESVLIYSKPGQAKLRNIERNPRVALHLDSDRRGGDVVVVTGEARVDSNARPAAQVEGYVSKYARSIRRIGYDDADAFAADYSVAIRIAQLRIRGF